MTDHITEPIMTETDRRECDLYGGVIVQQLHAAGDALEAVEGQLDDAHYNELWAWFSAGREYVALLRALGEDPDALWAAYLKKGSE